MRAWFVSLLLVLSVILSSCGGGGGGGGSTVTLTGAVEWITTGAAPSPGATVQGGGTSTTTGADGSFSLTVPTGTSSVLVIFTPAGGSPVTTQFTFTGLTANSDLGTLVIGPSSITVTGLVKSGQTGAVIPNAQVSFAGRTGLTDATGRYTLLNVAYDPAQVANFTNLEGTALATGYLASRFHPSTGAVGSTASLDDILMVPVSGSDPPGFPSTVSGTVTPAGSAPGTVLTLLVGSTPVRQVIVPSGSNTFGFWIGPGTYTLRATNPTNSLSAPDASVTVVSTSDNIVQNVALH